MQKAWYMVSLILTLALGIGGIAAAQDDDTDTTPWLGIAIADSEDGVVVQRVARNSPAEDAGIEIDDVIVAFGSAEVTSAQQLVELVQGAVVGDTITITLQRGGEELEVDVTLGETPDRGRPDRPHWGYHTPFSDTAALTILGVVTELTDEGYEVIEVAPEADQDFQVGDIITEINGNSILGTEGTDLFMLMMALEEPVEVTVLRDGTETTLQIDYLESDVPPGGLFEITPGGRIFMAGDQGYLGVAYHILTPEFAQNLGITTQQGALLTDIVPDSPAKAAELAVGDIITAVDGELVDEDDPLDEVLSDYKAGDTVTLTVVRAGEEREVQATLETTTDSLFFMPHRDGRMPFMPGIPYRPGRPFGGEGGFNFGQDTPFFFDDGGEGTFWGVPFEHLTPEELEELMPNGSDRFNVTCTDQDGNTIFSFRFNGIGRPGMFDSFVFPDLEALEAIEGVTCEITGDESQETPQETDNGSNL
jgi:S1-C subfamily serine protease